MELGMLILGVAIDQIDPSHMGLLGIRGKAYELWSILMVNNH